MEIFLSHSGKQKDFAYILHNELSRAHRTCFFDQDTADSLPKGDLIHNKILESINGCKLGVVIVSDDFVTSLWPMAELQNLISDGKRIYPIFYGLRPSDLLKENNLQRWEKEWEKVKNHGKCLPYDIRKWKDCLSTVRYTAGSEFGPALNSTYMYPFIRDTVVPQVCVVCQSHLVYFPDEKFIKGKQRMAQEIGNNFQTLIEAAQSQGNVKLKLFVLGLHGMAGVGKTTLCKTMVDYYNERGFNGSSCLIELPTDKVELGALVPKLREALKRLTHIRKGTLDEITDFDQGISILKQKIRGTQAFLAIDNVCKWSYEYVRKILHYMIQEDNKGDIRVMVTSQDKTLLDNLGGIKEIHYHSTQAGSYTRT